MSGNEITKVSAENAIENLAALDPKEISKKTVNFNVEYDFTPNELKTISSFSKKINVLDNNSLITYGTDAQAGLTDFSDKRFKASIYC